MDKLRIFLLLALITGGSLHAQENSGRDSPALIRRAEVIHYDRNDFQADPQFWTACEDDQGILYFGNNDGALAFDGEEWNKIFLPNRSSVRSLIASNDGQIYAGGYNELGIIERDSLGHYRYHSLLDTLQLGDENFENLWQADRIDDHLIFRSFKKLFVITQGKVTELPAAGTLLRSFVVDGNYFVQDSEVGILRLDLTSMSFEDILNAEAYKGEELIGLFDPDETEEFLSVTKKGDVFRFRPGQPVTTPVVQLFPIPGNNLVISSIESKGVIYAGTLSSGIIAFDPSGQIIYNDRNMQRLQDQAVHYLFRQKNGNLWALLNNGIDKINLVAPVSVLFEDASIYDVRFLHGTIYLATNQGVFYSKPDGDDEPFMSFTKVPGLEGQAWSLSVIEDKLVICHDKGLFFLDQGHLSEAGDLPGIWKIIPATDPGSFYLACSYSGLYVIQKINGNWQVRNKIQGFEESTRDIVAGDEEHSFWVCHGYKGVFKIKVDDSFSRLTLLEQYTDKNGIPSPFNINCFRWNGQLAFTTNNGIYKYDRSKNMFEPFERLNAILDPELNTRLLLQQGHRTWYIQDDEAGYFSDTETDPKLHPEPFLRFKGTFNRSMELIHPLDSNRVLLGTNNGLYLVDLSKTPVNREVPTLITGVRYSDGKDLYALPLDAHKKLPNTTSAIRINFAAPGLSFSDETLYSYQLSNVDHNWSAWQSMSMKEYNHLPPGSYTFKVRSRGVTGVMGKEAEYSFDILPVWYHTTLAYILDVAGGVALFLLLLYRISRKLNEKNKSAWLEEQKARKLLELELKEVRLQTENERMEMEKELLEDDVIFKSKELANYTMLLIKKREIISEIREELRDLRQALRGSTVKKQLRDLLHKVDQHMSDEDHLTVFETNFEKVHQDFFFKLRSLHPDLSQRELQLCAFVKMNLSNKEISPLLNISVRGVETARYRIRKKLDLEHEANLVEFLESLVQVHHRNIPM